jgi:S1-C subfamily serine protease
MGDTRRCRRHALGLLLLVPAQAETVPSTTFPKELQVSATVAARVANVTKGTAGSGAVVRQDGAFVDVLTAAHVVEGAEQLDVHLFSAASSPKPQQVCRGKELARSVPEDLAVVRLAVATNGRMRRTERPGLAVEKAGAFPKARRRDRARRER